MHFCQPAIRITGGHGPCRNCGYCPCCGRANIQPWRYQPPVRPTPIYVGPVHIHVEPRGSASEAVRILAGKAA